MVTLSGGASAGGPVMHAQVRPVHSLCAGQVKKWTISATLECCVQVLLGKVACLNGT